MNAAEPQLCSPGPGRHRGQTRLPAAAPALTPAARCPAPAARRPGSAAPRAATPAASGRSLPEPLQCLGKPRQFLVQNPVQQLGTAVALDVLSDGLPRDFLHRPAFQLGPAPQRSCLIIGEPQCHRHTSMVSLMIPATEPAAGYG